jgi:hypothetical protein
LRFYLLDQVWIDDDRFSRNNVQACEYRFRELVNLVLGVVINLPVLFELLGIKLSSGLQAGFPRRRSIEPEREQ